jgi:hypothetical protein
MSRFTEEQKNYVNLNFPKYNTINEFSQEYAKHWGIPFSDTVRRSISKLLEREKLTSNIKTAEQSDDFKIAQTRKLNPSSFYIITSEMNETPLHQKFWNNLLAYKEFLKAELSVIPLRYKNPTSVYKEKIHENWSPQTKEYLDAARHDIHKYLTILADVKTQPTAVLPLSGMEDISGSKSAVIGHPKLHLQALPVLEGHPKKIILTTGSVSIPNYTDSKAGKKGENHHKNGFVIVEINSKEEFYIRQCEAAEDGSFIDLIYEVENGAIRKIDKCAAIVMGDVHVSEIDEEVNLETEHLLNCCTPDYLILHDIFNGISCNRHLVKDPIAQFKRYDEGNHLIEVELNEMKRWVANKLKYHPVIVNSNHNEWLTKYINEDWRKDIANSLVYMKYAQVLLEGNAPKGLIAHILEEEFGNQIITLGENDSFIVASHELGVHGHLGSNGSRGSFEQYRKLNYPVITGHSHTPMRRDNAISVGTSTILRPGYNKGASSWLHAHVILHDNGRAQQLIFINNKFTTFLD